MRAFWNHEVLSRSSFPQVDEIRVDIVQSGKIVENAVFTNFHRQCTAAE